MIWSDFIMDSFKKIGPDSDAVIVNQRVISSLSISFFWRCNLWTLVVHFHIDFASIFLIEMYFERNWNDPLLISLGLPESFILGHFLRLTGFPVHQQFLLENRSHLIAVVPLTGALKFRSAYMNCCMFLSSICVHFRAEIVLAVISIE